MQTNGFYFGHTSDLETRLVQHNGEKTKSIKHRIPFVIHSSESYATKAEAVKRELFFKSFEGRKWLYENKIL